MKDIVMPDLGEDIEEASISFWHVEEGEHVEEGTTLVEINTDKAALSIPAPCAGVLTERIAIEGETVGVGELLGRMEEEL